MKRYFYITTHFYPDYEETVFSKHHDDIYVNTETGDIYRKRLLYDFGWGQENGFELMPQLSLEELIKLVECPMVQPKKKFWQKYTKEDIQQNDIWRSNLYGAVAVVMQDYVKEFIAFLTDMVDTDYFSNPSIRDNFKNCSFSSKKQERRVRFRAEFLHNHMKIYLRITLSGKEFLQRLSIKCMRNMNHILLSIAEKLHMDGY